MLINNIKSNIEKHKSLIKEFEVVIRSKEAFDIGKELEDLKAENEQLSITMVLLSKLNFLNLDIKSVFRSKLRNKDFMELTVHDYLSNGDFKNCKKFLTVEGVKKPKATFLLGKIYLDGYRGLFGELIGLNVKESMDLFKKAYKSGYVESGLYYGVALYKKKKYTESQKVLNKMFLKHHNTQSGRLLTNILRYRLHTEKDFEIQRKIKRKISSIEVKLDALT
jgi:hypothetical protein